MNYALIFAGGTGQRMNSKSIPKQFLKVNGKEIIIHTIEIFEKSDNIDNIVVVCYEPYIDILKGLLVDYNIKKVKAICPGGSTGQESIFCGLKTIKDYSNNENDIVLIHDGVRPLINQSVIEKNIECVRENGTAITVSPAIETVVRIDDQAIVNVLDRNKCAYAKAPQSFYVKDAFDFYTRANSVDVSFIDSATIASYFGYKLFFVNGPIENIKITSQLDFYTFKAILDAKENSQLKELFI